MSKTPEVAGNPNANPPIQHRRVIQRTGATFQINNSNFMFWLALCLNNNTKFLEKINKDFKRTISWNKYRSELTTEPENNNQNI